MRGGFTARFHFDEAPFKRDVNPKRNSSFLSFCLHMFVNFTEKKASSQFYRVLINFHEVRKLQSFELNLTDVIPTDEHTLWFRINGGSS